ncbi:MAG: hypothetical protein QNJ63_16960 [Calothrix sp. MO_192.B10]|nr:hypothetical protein [Calothrix sp. MO_192.B10]
MAQTTPSPTVSPSPKPSTSPSAADVELLKSQIQFLQDINTRLNNSFGSFVSAMNVSLVAIGIILGVAGAISVYLFDKSLKQARLIIRNEVERRMKVMVEETVGEEVDNLKNVLEREKVIGTINVDYFLPLQKSILTEDYPEEFQLLNGRGFNKVNPLDDSKINKISGDVVVLDLVNYPLVTDEEKNNLPEDQIAQLIQTRVAEHLKKFTKKLPYRSVLVVYIRPGKQRINAIDELSQKVKYYSSANTPVSLMGVVVDSAYVAYSWKQ